MSDQFPETKKSPAECEVDARYYGWIDEHHPEYWAHIDYELKLEKQWRESLPTERDIMEAFPKEFKKSIRQRIPLLKRQQSHLLLEKRQVKNSLIEDPGNAWLYEGMMEALLLDEVHWERELKRLLWLLKPATEQEHLDIERAKLFPITQLIKIERRRGKCPWHTDKHPSLQYYDKQNKVYCFVCTRGGDAIDVAMATGNLTFKEAVSKLSC